MNFRMLFEYSGTEIVVAFDFKLQSSAENSRSKPDAQYSIDRRT